MFFRFFLLRRKQTDAHMYLNNAAHAPPCMENLYPNSPQKKCTLQYHYIQ